MISVLIPWRSAEPSRVAAWDFLRPQWDRLDVQLCVADDGRGEGKPFSVARAVNRARAMATGDTLLLYGADQFPPTRARLAAIADRLSRYPWTAVYATTRIFSPHASRFIINGADPTMCIAHSIVIGMCTGILAVRADVWDDAGGEDERFEGWGAEDTALRLVLRALHPAGNDLGDGELWSLWHPDCPRGEQTAENIRLCAAYEDAAARGQLREFLQGVRHG